MMRMQEEDAVACRHQIFALSASLQKPGDNYHGHAAKEGSGLTGQRKLFSILRVVQDQSVCEPWEGSGHAQARLMLKLLSAVSRT